MTIVVNRHTRKRMDLVATYGKDGDKGVYTDMLDYLVSYIKSRQKKELQTVIAITGRTGSGKSTLALQIAKGYNPDWDIESNYIYSVSDLKKKLKKGTAADPVSLFDEASVSLNSKNALAKADKEIVVLFDTMRSWKWITIMCLPSFSSLNKTVRDTHVDLLVTCPTAPLVRGYASRGFFEVYRPKTSTWASKPFWELIGAGVYGPLDYETDLQYQRIKLAHQQRLINKFISESED